MELVYCFRVVIMNITNFRKIIRILFFFFLLLGSGTFSMGIGGHNPYAPPESASALISTII